MRRPTGWWRTASWPSPPGRRPSTASPGPQDTWRLLEVLPERLGRGRRFPAPLVGRELEGELLRRLFDRVVAEQSCHLASVLGEGGVGTSRLVDEFVGGLGERSAVLCAQCPQLGGSVTVWPLVEIVRQAAGITSADLPEAARQRVAELVRGQQRRDRPLVHATTMTRTGVFVEILGHCRVRPVVAPR